MRHKTMTGFWSLVAVIGTAAVVGMGPDKARTQDPLPLHKSRRGAIRFPTQDGGERKRAGTSVASMRSDSRRSPNATLEAGGSLCALPAGNCQDRDHVDARRSDRIDFFLADDFVPAADGAISQLCWRGGYFDFDSRTDCQGEVTGNRFQIRYFADAGGLPGQLLAEFRQEQPGTPLTLVDSQRTGVQIADRVDEFEYTATHTGAPVPVQAGQCYWVEISNLVLTGRCAGDASPCRVSTQDCTDSTLCLGDAASTCVWVWETSADGDDWAMLDNDRDGYDMADSIGDDLAFCLDVPLDDPTPCVPLPPANDMCASAQQIAGDGIFSFDNTTARTDGQRHTACQDFGEDQIEADVWFCWTAPCTDVAVIWTCDLTDLDTRVAVYDGCASDNCPPTDADLETCNDDRCGNINDPRQTMVTFDAVADRSYLIRIGLYPGERHGAGSFGVSCGPPENAGCPGEGDCCDEAGSLTPGCDDGTCCAIVCLCDPYCCGQDPAGQGFWDATCALSGWQGAPDCGAQELCVHLCDVCGDPAGGDCCTATPTTPDTPGIPGCSDEDCCTAVCDVDEFCCEVEWDESCATTGVNCSGAGAQVLCPDLCAGLICPDVEITWVDPPDCVVDARQPHSHSDAGELQGIDRIIVDAPGCTANVNCWTLSDTSTGSPVNEITTVVINEDQTVTIQLLRPITPGAVTTLTYKGNETTAHFTSHPGNANGDGQSNAGDITTMIDILSGVINPLWGSYSADIDHSGRTGPADILRLIDLLTGGGAFAPGWNDSDRPVNEGSCP